MMTAISAEHKQQLRELKDELEQAAGQKLAWTDSNDFHGSSWADLPGGGTVSVMVEPPEGQPRVKTTGVKWDIDQDHTVEATCEQCGKPAEYDPILILCPECVAKGYAVAELNEIDAKYPDWDAEQEESQPDVPDDFDQESPDLPALFESGSVEIDALGAKVTGDLSYEEWDGYMRSLFRFKKALRWIIGDLLNYGEAAYGEQYAQAYAVAETLNLSVSTIQQYKSVAGRIPKSERTEDVDWSTWRFLAGKTTKERRIGIEASASGCDYHDIRDMLGGDDATPQKRPPCPVCGGETTNTRCKACGVTFSSLAWHVADLREEVEQYARTGQAGKLLAPTIREAGRDISSSLPPQFVEAVEYWLYLETVEPSASTEDRVAARDAVALMLEKAKAVL